jgi:hypothetical protein
VSAADRAHPGRWRARHHSLDVLLKQIKAQLSQPEGDRKKQRMRFSRCLGP